MILVTGGTGLLGAHLLYQLLQEGKEVKAIRRSTKNIPEVRKVFSYYSDNPAELVERITWVKADILNYEEMLEVMEGVDEVYHCAAMVSFDPAHRAKMIHINKQGTANVVNAALAMKIRKLCHVSSTAAVGKSPDGLPSEESMIWSESKSNTGYSISKFKSEMEVWRGIEEGLNAVIVNPSIILGPGFWKHGSSSIFTKVKGGLRFYSTGVTGYVSVWDVVEAMTQLMESDISAERYLLSSENLTYQDVFNMTADALDVRRPYVEGTKFMSELAWRIDWVKSKFFGIGEHTFTKERVRSARTTVYFNNEKIKKELDFEFQPIPEVIEKVADYFTRK